MKTITDITVRLICGQIITAFPIGQKTRKKPNHTRKIVKNIKIIMIQASLNKKNNHGQSNSDMKEVRKGQFMFWLNLNY